MSRAHALVTALALYGFPYAPGGGASWWVLRAADVLVLAAVAFFSSSPLVVLVAAIVSPVFYGTWGVRRGPRAL